MLGIQVPEAVIHDWDRLCYELTDQVLTGKETVEELALTASIRRKRPDAIAIHWSRRVVWILEFSRVNDSRDDWCKTVER